MAQPQYYGQPQPGAYAAQPGYVYNPTPGGYPQPAYGVPQQQAHYGGAAPPAPMYYAPPPPGVVYASSAPAGATVYSPHGGSPTMMVVDPYGGKGVIGPDGGKAASGASVGASGGPYGGGGGASAGTDSAYLDAMNRMVRMGFIRKVYSVLAVQLLVTFGIVAIFTFSDPVRKYVQTNPALLWSAIGVSFVTIIAMACCTSVTRKFPYNYLALAVFTLAEAYLVGTIASFYTTDAVLIAIGGTVLLTLGLTIFAWQTKIDFTAMSSSIFVIALTFFFFGILVAITRSGILRLVYACIGVLVYGLFLVYDTQLIMGGKHRDYEYGPDEYILAALNVYLDVINIFLYLLQILGSRRD